MNSDGSIQVLEANRNANAKGSPPNTGTYQSTAGMTFSKSPITEAPVLGATAKTLFEKVLAGKNTEADDKKLKQMGYNQNDIDAYAESKP